MVDHTAVTRAVESLAAGNPVVIVDNRECDPSSSGELVVAAEVASSSLLTFLVANTTGFLTAPMTEADLARLGIPAMVAGTSARRDHVAVDATDGIGTGISACDRTRTLAVLADPRSGVGDVRRPGHVIPHAVHVDGVLGHPAPAEAAIELLELAHLRPVAGCATIADSRTGHIRAGSDVRVWARGQGLHIVSIDDLVLYRRAAPRLTLTGASPPLTGRFDDFSMRTYTDSVDPGSIHMALTCGDLRNGRSKPLIHLHSGCPAGDLAGSSACSCGVELDNALRAIAERGRGVVVCLQGGSQNNHSDETCGTRLPSTYQYWLAAQVLHECQVDSGELYLWDRWAADRLFSYGIKSNENRTRSAGTRNL